MHRHLAPLALTMACMSTWPAVAAPPSNPFSDSQYRCDFPPTSGIKLGRVFRMKPVAGLYPAHERSMVATRQYDVPDPDIRQMSTVDTVPLRHSEKVDGVTAADYVMAIGGVATKINIEGNYSKEVTISREIGPHSYAEITDDQLRPAREWFAKYKTTNLYKKTLKDWTYFVVREIWLADGMSVSINKDDAARLGVGVDVSGRHPSDVSRAVEAISDETYAIKGKFPRLSIFCVKFERLS